MTIYNGDAFPAAFRGLLLPDVVQKNVQGVPSQPRRLDLAVTEQFDLLRSEDPLFRPVQVVVGPDGAIYIVDWRTNSTGPGWFWGDAKHGRIWRLTWQGTADMPAIARGKMDTWSKLATLAADDLIAKLDSTDGQLRTSPQQQLMKRQENKPSDARRQSLIAVAKDTNKSPAARAASLCVAARTIDSAGADALVAAIAESKTQPELARLAVELIGHNASTPTEATLLYDRLLASLDTLPAPAARSAAIALGEIAMRFGADDVRRTKAAEALLRYLDTHTLADDPFLLDGLVRGIEPAWVR